MVQDYLNSKVIRRFIRGPMNRAKYIGVPLELFPSINAKANGQQNGTELVHNPQIQLYFEFKDGEFLI